MQRMFFSFLLSLALLLPSPASASDALPQWTNTFGMSFRLIPAGKSVIGRDGWAGVSPRRIITFSRDFGMGTTEVTQGQWKAVMGGENPGMPFVGDNLPVNCVSWDDAQRFIARLNDLDAPRRYRLPSNAEWEYAYRAGSEATWITGDGTPVFPESLREYEWFGTESKTHPVAQKKPNAWGLYDMGGNVCEWVQDYWQHDYYESMPASDPVGPVSGPQRVCRGASYEDPIKFCSFASRNADRPTRRHKSIGFRVVLEGTSFQALLSPTEENKAVTLPAEAQAYAPILANLRHILAHGLAGRNREDGEHGVMEAVTGREGQEALRSVGWLVRDLSGDGIPELIIGAVEQSEDGKFRGSQIYAIYTLKNSKPHLTQEGTFRNAFALMDNGQLMHHGSGGAMTQTFGVCGLSKDGSRLLWRDFWFTMHRNSAYELGFYRNSSGKLDKKFSREINESAFNEATEVLLSQRRDVDLTPFCDWKETDSSSRPSSRELENGNTASTPAVRLQWARDIRHDLSASHTFTAGKEEPQVQIAVLAQRPLNHIKVLDLDCVGVDENGKAHFTTSELFSLDTLLPAQPLILTIPMLGTIPHYGISYMEDRKAYQFAITESGEDGSLVLMSF